MTRTEKIELLMMLDERERRRTQRKLWTYYPDEGPLRRDLYPRHCAFFAAGKTYRQRLFLAANRIGKTEGVGLYELVMHATGRYPAWWTGRRFERPIEAWAAGDTQKTVRDILQRKLFGPINLIGTGVLPGECIERTVRSHGVADAIEGVLVKHTSGGTSKITLKSYEQRREAFQGTEQDVILLDEEPPLDIYTECLLRTATNNGMLMLTFTPLRGISDVVMAFLPETDFAIEDEGRGDETASRYVVMAGWDDVPHLTAEAKAQLLASIPAFQRDARTKGVPQLGAGAIYPVPESEILVDDFEIPKHWPRVYGLDVGWNWTAAVWLAWDRASDTVYLYSAYKRGQAEPSLHSQAIKARGDWIPGVIDPASSGSNQVDGQAVIDVYNRLGLKLSYANNEVEAGIYDVWERLSTGRLKVFRSLTEWCKEYRVYRRDEKGKVVKKDDHLMDGTRYAIRSGLAVAKVQPGQKKDKPPEYVTGGGSGSWMGQ